MIRRSQGQIVIVDGNAGIIETQIWPQWTSYLKFRENKSNKMPTLSPSQVILIGIFVAPAIFALCAYFTRAGLRRIVRGLAGVVAFSLVQYLWDRAAAVIGWWTYPGYGTASNLPMPVTMYLFSGLVFAGFGLIGWRIGRRFGWRGVLAFLVAWSLWGFSHDIIGSSLFSSSQLMVIEPGVAPRIADFLVYATCMAAVLMTIRVLGGPLRADRLARTSE